MNDKDDSGDFKCKMGQESGHDKEVKGNKRTNLVHSGKNVFNSVNVNTFTVLSKLNSFYTNADQLFNKMEELIARPRDSKPNIIGITEVKPKLNRYKPALAEFSLTEVGRAMESVFDSLRLKCANM